jgi:predicted lipoprotein with Yx(FWY)xxD motif
MRITRVIAMSLLAIAASVALVAPALSAPTAAGAATIHVGSSKLGRILVNSNGRTVYLWAHDKGSRSTCSGQCAQYWPPVITHGKPHALGGARASLLGTTKRADGRMQVTYSGHPLYTFVMDTKPGQTKGEGLTGFGGRWDPVSISGRAVRAHAAKRYSSPVKVRVLTPGPRDIAGAGGVFNIDLSLQAQNAQGNNLLSAANGYVPFFNDIGSATFGPGMKDPGAPGLVVTLSTTPAAAGGPNANLAGVFQLNAVSKHNGLIQTYNDWQVGSAGFFGVNKRTTLTAYVVRGTAPGMVSANGPRPISNVVHETFTIGA